MSRDFQPIDFVPGIDDVERQKNPRAWLHVEEYMRAHTGHELRLRYQRGYEKPFRAALWFITTNGGQHVEELRALGSSPHSFSDAVAQLGV